MSDHSEGAGLTRQAIRTPRAAALAGIVFSVLLAASFVLVRWALPSDPDAAGEWLSDGGRRDAFVLALNLLPFAGIAFLWFIGVLRDRIGAHEDRFFATVFLGSGLLFVAMLFTCGAVAGGLVLSYGEGSGRPPAELWSFGRQVTLALQGVYAMRMAAVFTISATTIAARLGLAPRWLSVFGMATGVLLLVIAGAVPWIEILFPLWVFVFSAHILIATFSSQQSGDS
ncbi:MAG TPA: hypothetical protein VFH02_12170 [Jiangellaceae bacterium]|jgi:hypothetical protein|nr:hypothetical protein [Jiangellaceae bacterium]